MKPRLILFGTSPFGLASFTALREESSLEVVAVVSQPARPVGRKQLLTPSPVSVWAETANIPVITPDSLKKMKIQEQLRNLRPDVFIVAAYGLILPPAVLDIPKRGSLNIHASLLPKYRGASPIASAILSADHETGITYMLMDAGCDTGPILKQEAVLITQTETKPQLEERLARTAAKGIGSVVHDWLGNRIQAHPQPLTGGSSAPLLRRPDGRCTWLDATLIERKIRAYQPWPGVWTTYNGNELKILNATVADETVSVSPGTVVAHEKSWGVACQRGLLLPTTVQLSGKKPQDASMMIGGYPGFVGSILV